VTKTCKGCGARARDRGFERSELCSLQCERAFEAGRRAGAEEERERWEAAAGQLELAAGQEWPAYLWAQRLNLSNTLVAIKRARTAPLPEEPSRADLLAHPAFSDITIGELAARVHQAYLDTCDRLGWKVRPENRVPYAELSPESKQLDLATVCAVLDGLRERRANDG
jgi:hypothetical protein